MPLIDYPDIEELDDRTRGILEEMRTERGEIPSFPQLLASNPAIFEATIGQFREVVYGGEVPPALKQLAFVVVSQENECPYCAATHGDELVTAFDLPESYLDAIADAEYDRFTTRQQAVAEFARQGAIDPKRISEDYIADLRDAGFDDGDIVELLTVVAQAMFANTIADAMNLHPTDQSPALEQFYSTVVRAGE